MDPFLSASVAIALFSRKLSKFSVTYYRRRFCQIYWMLFVFLTQISKINQDKVIITSATIALKS